MKSTVALSLLATVTFHQVAFAQDEDQQVNIATAPAMLTLPTLNTDIYWWKTLLTGSEISNYLTGPATEAATAAAATAAAATPTPEASSEATPTASGADASSAATTEDATLSAAATSAESALASVTSSLESAISEASSAISDILSSSAVVSDSILTTSGVSATPSSVVAWSSSSSASYSVPTIVGASSGVLPRPSGSIIPPVITSTTISPSNSGALVVADIGKILFSVTIAAFLGNFLN